MEILKFYTETCMPCRVVGKMLDGMGLEVESINAMEDTYNVDKYNVCTTPTLVFLNDKGEEFGRTTGPVTASKIQEVIASEK